MKNFDPFDLDIDERRAVEMYPCEDYIHLGRIYEHYTRTVWWWGYSDYNDVYCIQDCIFCDDKECKYIFYFKKNHFSTEKCRKYGGVISFIMAYNKISATEALGRIDKMLNGENDW